MGEPANCHHSAQSLTSLGYRVPRSGPTAATARGSGVGTLATARRVDIEPAYNSIASCWCSGAQCSGGCSKPVPTSRPTHRPMSRSPGVPRCPPPPASVPPARPRPSSLSFSQLIHPFTLYLSPFLSLLQLTAYGRLSWLLTTAGLAAIVFATLLATAGASSTAEPSTAEPVSTEPAQRWNFTTARKMYSSPALSQDGATVFVGSHDNHLYAVETGAKKRTNVSEVAISINVAISIAVLVLLLAACSTVTHRRRTCCRHPAVATHEGDDDDDMLVVCETVVEIPSSAVTEAQNCHKNDMAATPPGDTPNTGQNISCPCGHRAGSVAGILFQFQVDKVIRCWGCTDDLSGGRQQFCVHCGAACGSAAHASLHTCRTVLPRNTAKGHSLAIAAVYHSWC